MARQTREVTPEEDLAALEKMPAYEVGVYVDRGVGSGALADEELARLRRFLQFELTRYVLFHKLEGRVTLHAYVAVDPILPKPSPGVTYDPDKVKVTKIREG